jgi:hypothetical protein
MKTAKMVRGVWLVLGVLLLVGCAADVSDMNSEALGTDVTYRLRIAGITPDQRTIIGGFKTMSGADSHILELGDGVLDNNELLAWNRRAEAGTAERRSGTVTVLDQDLSTIIAQYNISGVLPLSVEGAVPRPGGGLRVFKAELYVEDME